MDSIPKTSDPSKPRRVAISLELDWAYNRHLEVYAGVQRYAHEKGWNCSVHPAPERTLALDTGETRYDGIIARATSAMAKSANEHNVPIVNVWLNSPVRNLPSVFCDYKAAGTMAAEHLLARGFRQFGYMGFKRDMDSILQQAGFCEVIERENFSCNTYLFGRSKTSGKNALGWENFTEGLEAWVDSWTLPFGIFVTQDLYCRYLIDLCRSKGLHVSHDVAIVGCQNEAAICAAPEPTLTSIDMGYALIGYRAAAMLDNLMSGGTPPKEPKLLLPTELIPRQSTDSYAADDPMVARALRYIAENGHQRMEVSDVVAAVATARRSLERRFRNSVGCSIAGEITRLRLERAKRRIVETDAPIKTVAESSGFRNADHFYKVFTRVEGMPPTQYREERQKVFVRRDV